MMKSTQTVAVVKRRRNGKDPIGCGFGEGRGSGLELAVSTCDAGYAVTLTSWRKGRCHSV